MNLLVVGATAFDKIETPFGKTDKMLGGPAPYIAISSSYLGAKPTIISVVGHDFPKEYIDLIESKGVDLSGLVIDKIKKTFFWSAKYHHDMNHRDTLITELNSLESFDPKLTAKQSNCDYVMLGNLHPSIQLSVVNQMSKRPKLIALDTMNYWMDNALSDLLKVIKKIDLLIINDEEARQLSKEYSLKKASKKILEMGPKYLIIKKGEHGAFLFSKTDIFFTPALPLEEVFDPTGAGDTFAGGVVGYLAKTDNTSFNNIKKSIIYGSAMASFTVEDFGLNRLIKIKENELENRLSQFKNLVKID